MRSDSNRDTASIYVDGLKKAYANSFDEYLQGIMDQGYARLSTETR